MHAFCRTYLPDWPNHRPWIWGSQSCKVGALRYIKETPLRHVLFELVGLDSLSLGSGNWAAIGGWLRDCGLE